ncbi:MAG: hypothetical protein ACK5M3_15865 [Dysgonomonas sp.]
MNQIDKSTDKQEAINIAKEKSIKENTIYYVILSKGEYYVDTSDFVRVWESLICIVENGKYKNEEL